MTILALDPARICERCGSAFQRRSTKGRSPRYCSKRCRTATWAANPERSGGRKCSCGRPVLALGLCDRCYKRDLKQRNPGYAEQERRRSREWAAANQEHIATYGRAKRAFVKYGLTLEEYEAFLAKPCGICGAASTVLDHCHETGRARGGLCDRCNTGVGFYETWLQHHEERIIAWLRF